MILGLAEFKIAFDAWIAAVEEHVPEVARGLAVQSFRHMLRISPQYSGDFVANWNVSVGTPDESFREYLSVGDRVMLKKEPRVGGDREAQQEAISRNSGKAGTVKLGETIYITNASRHTDYYAPLIENEAIRFRPGNAGAVIANTVQFMMSQAHELNAAEAAQLAAERF